MKSSTHYFHMKTEILEDFQICISVPLMYPMKSLQFFETVQIMIIILKKNSQELTSFRGDLNVLGKIQKSTQLFPFQ